MTDIPTLGRRIRLAFIRLLRHLGDQPSLFLTFLPTSKSDPHGGELVDDDAALAMLNEAFHRWENCPPVQLELTRRDAWIIMAALQLVIRHPDAPLRATVEKVARQIQNLVCDQPMLWDLAELGWDPNHDRKQP